MGKVVDLKKHQARVDGLLFQRGKELLDKMDSETLARAVRQLERFTEKKERQP